MTSPLPSRRGFLTGAAAAIAAALPPRQLTARNSVTHTVIIGDFVFAPERLEARPGNRIRWINRDIVPHTATAIDESWDTGEIPAGGRGEILLKAGTVERYFCRFHPSMKARIILAE